MARLRDYQEAKRAQPLHRLTTFIQRVDRRRRWRLLQKVWTAWLREKLARQKRLREAAGEQAGGATRAAGGQEGGATAGARPSDTQRAQFLCEKR